MSLLDILYNYFTFVFEFFTFRTKPCYKQLTDLENRCYDQEGIEFSNMR
jgi:hypothetical protein